MSDEPQLTPEEEEAKLLARLEILRAERTAKEQYLKDWDAAIKDDETLEAKKAELSKAVTLYDIEIIRDSLHFKVDSPREDVTTVIRNHKSTKLNYINDEWTINVSEWYPLTQELYQLKNIFIRYNKIKENEIKEWKAAPNYHVDMDNRGFIVKVGPLGSPYLLRSITGAVFDYSKHHFRIPFTESWKIPAEFVKYNAEGVEYTPEAKDFIEKQLTLRSTLDQIAERETPLEPITMRDGLTLKDFQAVTVEYSEAAGDRIVCGHEMGLGKTPIALAVFERVAARGEGKKFLIVVPASLKPNWSREIRKFTNFVPYELYGSTPSNFDMAQILAGEYRYYIINYDILAEVTKIPEKFEKNDAGEMIKTEAKERFLWVDILNAGGFDGIAVDEAHYCKNVGSYRSRAVRELVSPRILLLTGTPLLNRPSELWPLIAMIDKDVAGPYETFVKNYTIDGKHPRNVDELREVLKPIMFRKTKKDVLKELPPINRITREYQLSSTARRQYDMVLDGLWADIKRWDGSSSGTEVITSILAQLLKMKQVCAWDKTAYTADLATELYDQSSNGHRKVLIFSQFVNSPECVSNIAARLAPESLWFAGGQEVHKRMDIVDEFQTNDEKHFLSVGLKAAREGLNITAAGSVIFNDLDWTPANHHQAEARAYGRLSDLHSVNSYYIVSEGTIEDDIMELLEAKLNIFNAIIEGTEEARDSTIVMELIKRLKERM